MEEKILVFGFVVDVERKVIRVIGNEGDFVAAVNEFGSTQTEKAFSLEEVAFKCLSRNDTAGYCFYSNDGPLARHIVNRREDLLRDLCLLGSVI